jgi:hypothetical protein
MLKNISLAVYLCSIGVFGSQTFACAFPSDLPDEYRMLYNFTKNLKTHSLNGVDECLGPAQDPLDWQFKCDDQNQFLEARAELFLLPSLIFIINKDLELEVDYKYLDQWNHSKVSPSELAEITVQQGENLRLVYTTNSARKVYMTLGRANGFELTVMESLVYKMNLGKPTLESKFSCYVD